MMDSCCGPNKKFSRVEVGITSKNSTKVSNSQLFKTFFADPSSNLLLVVDVFCSEVHTTFLLAGKST